MNMPNIPPEDVVPSRKGRPNKATVVGLLAQNGRPTKWIQPVVITDTEGIPAFSYTTEDAAVLTVSLPLLGWTQAEYDDPTVTE